MKVMLIGSPGVGVTTTIEAIKKLSNDEDLIVVDDSDVVSTRRSRGVISRTVPENLFGIDKRLELDKRTVPQLFSQEYLETPYSDDIKGPSKHSNGKLNIPNRSKNKASKKARKQNRRR